jgi:hypothetical protein
MHHTICEAAGSMATRITKTTVSEPPRSGTIIIIFTVSKIASHFACITDGIVEGRHAGIGPPQKAVFRMRSELKGKTQCAAEPRRHRQPARLAGPTPNDGAGPACRRWKCSIGRLKRHIDEPERRRLTSRAFAPNSWSEFAYVGMSVDPRRSLTQTGGARGSAFSQFRKGARH